jgi:Zn-dependent metalloprotease
MHSTFHYAAVLLWVAALVITAAPQVAQALLPADQNGLYEIPLRGFDLLNYRGPGTESAREATVDAVSQRYGGTWRIYAWNPQTRTPSFVYGSGIDLAPAAASRTDLETIARSVVAANPEVFHIDPANLRLHQVVDGLGKRAVQFRQTYHGLEVWGGHARLTFTDAGRLFVMGGELYDTITVDPTPALTLAQAEDIAVRDLPFNAATDQIEEGGNLLILPEPLSETEVTHHLVWRVRVHTAEPLGVWVTHVDAHNGEIIWRYNDVHFLDVTGSVSANTELDTWCNGQTQLPCKYIRVAASGYPTVYTDQNGNFTVPNVPQAVSVTTDFYGPYARVVNQAGPEASLTLSIAPGTPAQFIFTDRNSQNDERDAFDAMQQIHDFFEEFAPNFYFTDTRMTCNVSVNSTCNAVYTGSINLFREGDGCANTGRIQGVAEHEYGHGVQEALIGWQGEEGLGEGNGDVLANLLTQESIIGRGFYLFDCENGIRDSENSLIYPDNVVDQEIHDAGRVIAGFHWDLMVLLQQLYGTEAGTLAAAELWHYARALQGPYTQPLQVMATFVADDDDGNLDNGTPHYDLLCEAAQNHGFECPAVTEGVFITHTPPQSLTSAQDVELLATITSTEANLDAASLSVFYSINDGAPQTLPLTPTGQPDEYHATLTGLSVPMEIDYYLYAEDLLGNERTEPSMAPSQKHSFDLGWVYDPFESESGWAVNLEGTDTATEGIWEQADPNGSACQPEDDYTPQAGTLCWVTGNGTPGQHPLNNDVDDGPTTLYSPVYNLSGASIAEVSYWRWFSNNKGYAKRTETWVVQARNNGGAWVDVENTQDDQSQWVEREVDLLTLFGSGLGSVQFRFIASDYHTSLIDALVDEFVIRALLDSPSVVPTEAGPAPRLALLGSRSNPVMGPAEIAFQVPASTAVRIGIFDVNGRLVRALTDQTFAPGVHTLAWDGRDTSGQATPSGIYYCRMQAPGFDATRTMVISH